MTNEPIPDRASPHFSILIVEDEGIIANHIASLLRKTGYDVAGIAESSEEALAQAAASEPDLILMDIRIKGSLDGIDTALKIRERHDVPIIYLTAHSDHETIGRAKVTGASGFLTKPIHHTGLATSVEMAIYKHRSDREMRLQRALMAATLGAMASATIVVDAERRVQFLNRHAEELTGWADGPARGTQLCEVLPLAEAASGLQADDALLPGMEPKPRFTLPEGLIAARRSGGWFPIEGEVASGFDGARLVGFVITFRDATARREQQNELLHQHKMQAVGRLAAGIAHDFNNLLFVILGYTEEVLRRASISDTDRRALNEIRKAGDTAAGITQQLLSFSRKEPPVKRELSLNDVVRDTEELFRRLAGPSVQWNFVLDPNPEIIRADQGQIKQALMNLVANARDAMPRGGTITVKTDSVEIPRLGLRNAAIRMVRVSVADTGTGMSPETAERLFEPFFTTRGAGKGTGLGLSIVHSIVTDLGGTVHVRSEPGEGAEFTLYIPVAASAGGAPVFVPPLSAGANEPATVLLVEEEDAVRHLLRDYLASAGCTVLEARNTGEALRLANSHEGWIDLLIANAALRSAAGFDLAREMTRSRAGIRTLFISGYAQDLIGGETSVPAGARFLPKPFGKRDLLKSVVDSLSEEKHLSMRSPA
jgi:PAS domain S-box-containing protein